MMMILGSVHVCQHSYSLFAQHIRRNVLRVFSDASNSVISQQLGDLWRTVPRSCRNQYDDEANRLVKIHQIEFPNYKYQPKKRQITSSSSSSSSSSSTTTTTTTATTTTANTSRSNSDQMRMVNPNQFHNTTHTLTQSSISMNSIREDQLITSSKLLSTNLLKTSTDYNVVYSSSSSSSSASSSSSSFSSTVTNKLPTLSNRNYSIPAISSMNSSVVKGQTTNDNNELMNNFMTSPSKLVCNTIYAKLEPKPLSVNIINTTNNSSIPMNNNNNTTTNSSQTLSFKPTIHSLSSVLPPLITLSSNHHHHHAHHHHQTNGLMNEQFSLGICDSAYASGINSSSSSSAASSPAVGELISPAKSYSSTFSSLSSSSSSSTSSSLSNMNIKQTKHSPIRRKIHFIPIRPQSQQLPPVGNQPTRQRFLSANNGITTNNTTNITTTNNSNISTIGNGYIQMNGFQFKSNSENVIILPRKLNDLHVEQKDDQLTDEFMNDTLILQENNDNNDRMVTTDILTPVYIQLDHEGQNPLTEGLMLTLPPGTTFIQANHDSMNRGIPLNNNNTISKRFYITNGNRMVPEPILYSPLMSSSELLSSSSYSCNSSPNSIVSPLSGDVFLPMQQVEMMSNSTHFNTYDQQSSCMDIYQFNGQNQLDIISIDNDLNDTDFSITNDNDNFDSSFDAMMNSIDITTFLPGTFQTNEEQDQSIHNDYDHVQLNSYHHNQHEFMKMDEFDESCHIINDVIATTTITSATTVATIASSSSSFMNKPTNSQLYNVIRSDIDLIHYNHLENENRTVRIISPLQKIEWSVFA
uniref:Putative transcription factor SOX-14 n=1 Tax=Schistosoma haematobium TaxID=6185 RepID=A0A094ZYC2_SCHHA